MQISFFLKSQNLINPAKKLVKTCCELSIDDKFSYSSNLEVTTQQPWGPLSNLTTRQGRL